MNYLERRTQWRHKQPNSKIAILDVFGQLLEHQSLDEESNPEILHELGLLHDRIATSPNSVLIDNAIRAATQLPPTDSVFLLDSITSSDEQVMNDAFNLMPANLRARLEHLVQLIGKADILLSTFSPTALSTIDQLMNSHAQKKTIN